MQPNEMLLTELTALGKQVATQQQSLGARPLGRDQLIMIAISAISQAICPRREMLKDRLERHDTQLSLIILDTVIIVLLKIEAPIATICEKLLLIGLDRFCQDPSLIVHGDDIEDISG